MSSAAAAVAVAVAVAVELSILFAHLGNYICPYLVGPMPPKKIKQNDLKTGS